MAATPQQFWIGVVSREHVHIGVNGGFIQLNHGKKAPLQRLRAGDGVVMYSPRTSYPDGEPLQRFTAIGVVSTGAIYQVEMAEDFKPYRVGGLRLRRSSPGVLPRSNTSAVRVGFTSASSRTGR